MKAWVWFRKSGWKPILIGIGAAIVIIGGIGFIPTDQIAHSYTYACERQEPYSCTKQEAYSCLEQEAYTCYQEVPYTYTESEDLTYTTWGSDAYEDWGLILGCKVTEEVSVRNTDSEGGYFTVRFHCRYGNQWRYIDKTQYIGSWEHATFSAGFDIACEEPWSWKLPTVIPGTKMVTKTGYRTEARTCYREVTGTCYRDVPATCYRTVPDTCTGYWYETRRLFWNW